MYTIILAQGTKFGSGTTGLDNPVSIVFYSHLRIFSFSLLFEKCE